MEDPPLMDTMAAPSSEQATSRHKVLWLPGEGVGVGNALALGPSSTCLLVCGLGQVAQPASASVSLLYHADNNSSYSKGYLHL